MNAAPAPEPEAAAGTVRRRALFFVPGYEPRGVLALDPMWTRHAQALQATGEASLALAPRRPAPAPGTPDEPRLWHWQGPGPQVDNRMRTLAWDDLVRAQWRHGGPRADGDRLDLLRGLRATPAPWAMLKRGAGPLRVALLPLALDALVLALPAVGAAAGVLRLGPAPGVPLPGPAQAWMAALVAALLAWAARALLWPAALRLWRLDWPLRAGGFTVRQARGAVPGLDDRLDQFAQTLAAAIDDPAHDEVTVVGFSTGCGLAASALARALARARRPDAQVALLTLGSALPSVAWQREAEGFRRELRALAHDARLHWADVASPPDWAATAQLSPLDLPPALGPAPATPRLVLRSPRWHTRIDPARWQRLRRDKLALHLQYLGHAGTPRRGASEFDWLVLACGPAHLKDWPRPADARAGERA